MKTLFGLPVPTLIDTHCTARSQAGASSDSCVKSSRDIRWTTITSDPRPFSLGSALCPLIPQMFTSQEWETQAVPGRQPVSFQQVASGLGPHFHTTPSPSGHSSSPQCPRPEPVCVSCSGSALFSHSPLSLSPPPRLSFKGLAFLRLLGAF